jgi:hypothetical protein
MSEQATHDEELVGHEETDADIGPLIRFAIFLTVFTLAAAAATVGFYKFLDAREQAEKAPRYPMTVGAERPLPPAPRLQNYPFDDLKAYRRHEAELLDHYAWVDKNAGTVRIPVSRAMELLAERGLPHRATAEAPAAHVVPEAGSAPVAPPPASTGGHD